MEKVNYSDDLISLIADLKENNERLEEMNKWYRNEHIKNLETINSNKEEINDLRSEIKCRDESIRDLVEMLGKMST